MAAPTPTHAHATTTDVRRFRFVLSFSTTFLLWFAARTSDVVANRLADADALRSSESGRMALVVRRRCTCMDTCTHVAARLQVHDGSFVAIGGSSASGEDGGRGNRIRSEERDARKRTGGRETHAKRCRTSRKTSVCVALPGGAIVGRRRRAGASIVGRGSHLPLPIHSDTRRRPPRRFSCARVRPTIP